MATRKSWTLPAVRALRRSGQRAPRRGSTSSSTARRRAPRRTTARTATILPARRISQPWRGAALPSSVAMACARAPSSATAARARAPRSIRAAAMRHACSSRARSAASSTSAASPVPAAQSRRQRCAPRPTPAAHRWGRATLQRRAVARAPRAPRTLSSPLGLPARPPSRHTVALATAARVSRTKSSAVRLLRGDPSLERSQEPSAATRATPTVRRAEA